MRLGHDGAVIERQARGERPSEILFQARVEVVADLCKALMDKPSPGKPTPLDVLVSLVSQLHSADDVRSAFRAASAHLR